MTPAINALIKSKVTYNVLSYEHDSNNTQFGLEAVDKLKLNAPQVFKTLVLECNDKTLIAALTPVSQQVNVKQLAKLCGCKKVMMADVKKVQASTGYILGGVSPLGQKRTLKTYIHNSAHNFDTIYVSAGRRGLEIALSPHDLITLTHASCGEF
ncbi:Cys-tRNA(Pro) deacylase [Pseudoalteromonas sp. MMG010]|uniref:Cys-tRNA(Pro) deacylase n=1 Tax=Pseudoalteromonas sp. MMG010 TaxID=2822685 RepID=UPI001B39D52E|nr:Cys-tRNA(Pro) deacylase [Pseudoalteromonas sp. MMG010]MBQ4833702.1 Cys-tRNA(Pro) deacylase [Pseudoalteromonas sp. MMG010]